MSFVLSRVAKCHFTRVLLLPRDMNCNFCQIEAIHGEGWMAAQEMNDCIQLRTE
ncbi:MAG: hypothetical protein ACLQVJ_27700 [Syntrophobacteraceae bacterium]